MKSLSVIIFICLCGLTLAVPTQAAEPQVPLSADIPQLKWLDSANLDEMFEADIKAKKYEFYVFCGRGCDPIDIGYMQTLECYPTAKYRKMKGTSDALMGGEYDRLLAEAADFTRSYNHKLAEYLSNHGLSECQTGEDWNEALKRIDDLIGEHARFGEGASAPYDKEQHKFRFAVFLVKEHQKLEVYTSICAIAVQTHLSGKIIVEIYQAEANSPVSSISCENGRPLPSDWKPRPSDYPVLEGEDGQSAEHG